MNSIRICVASLVLLSVGRAEEFYLIDPAGAKLGPYPYEHDVQLRIATNNYTLFIPRAVKEHNAVVDKMRRIIIPEVDFRTAYVGDVAIFLEEESVKHDTGRKPLGVKMRLGAGQYKWMDADLRHTATFRARNVSLFEAVDLLCEKADVKWKVVDNMVTFYTRTKTELDQLKADKERIDARLNELQSK